MTITSLLGAPHISLVQVIQVVTQQMGAPLLHLHVNRYPGTYSKVYKPDIPTAFQPAKMAYASSLSALTKNSNRLLEAPTPIFVMVNAASTELEEYGIEIFPKDKWTLNDALYYHGVGEPSDSVIAKTKDVFQSIMESSTQSSLIQSLHALFYRIPDKDVRRKAQDGVYHYMSGQRAKPYITGIGKLDELQTSPAALILRAHVSYALIHGIDGMMEKHKDADEFEARYLIAKLDVLKRPAVERRKRTRKEV